jgi:hypothetical protein
MSASPSRRRGRPGPRRVLGAVLLVMALCVSCASVEFKPLTKTSGTFRSTGFSLTMLGIDIPKEAVQIARENAADAQLANTQVDRVFIFPYLGWFDWLLDILGFRYARISGTWGYPGD